MLKFRIAEVFVLFAVLLCIPANATAQVEADDEQNEKCKDWKSEEGVRACNKVFDDDSKILGQCIDNLKCKATGLIDSDGNAQELKKPTINPSTQEQTQTLKPPEEQKTPLTPITHQSVLDAVYGNGTPGTETTKAPSGLSAEEQIRAAAQKNETQQPVGYFKSAWNWLTSSEKDTASLPPLNDGMQPPAESAQGPGGTQSASTFEQPETSADANTIKDPVSIQTSGQTTGECGWTSCPLDRAKSAASYAYSELFGTSAAETKPLDGLAGTSIVDATAMVCKVRECDAPTFAKALGGSCVQESKCDPTYQHSYSSGADSQYQGLGQLSRTGTELAYNELINLRDSGKLSVAESQRLEGILQKIEPWVFNKPDAADPRFDPEAGAYLFAARHSQMLPPEWGRSFSPIENIQEVAPGDAATQSKLIQLTQLAPTIHTSGQIFDWDKPLDQPQIDAFKGNAISNVRTLNEAMDAMDTSRIYGTNLSRGVNWITAMTEPVPLPIARPGDFVPSEIQQAHISPVESAPLSDIYSHVPAPYWDPWDDVTPTSQIAQTNPADITGSIPGDLAIEYPVGQQTVADVTPELPDVDAGFQPSAAESPTVVEAETPQVPYAQPVEARAVAEVRTESAVEQAWDWAKDWFSGDDALPETPTPVVTAETPREIQSGERYPEGEPISAEEAQRILAQREQSIQPNGAEKSPQTSGDVPTPPHAAGEGTASIETARPTFRPETISLQEQSFAKNLQEQARILNDTASSLSPEAVARGAEACELAPAGSMCRRFESYRVTLETEQLKYERISVNYDGFLSYKNGGVPNPDLARSLAEIEKGQGATSAAIGKFTAPYNSAAAEWFSPVAESYKEGNWTGVAKESWRAVPALGNFLVGGLIDDATNVAERVLPESLGFSPAPEKAARCGAVGQDICNAEGAVSAFNVVDAVTGVGVVGYFSTKGVVAIGSRMLRSGDELIEGAATRVDDIARVDAPRLSVQEQIARAEFAGQPVFDSAGYTGRAVVDEVPTANAVEAPRVTPEPPASAAPPINPDDMYLVYVQRQPFGGRVPVLGDDLPRPVFEAPSGGRLTPETPTFAGSGDDLIGSPRPALAIDTPPIARAEPAPVAQITPDSVGGTVNATLDTRVPIQSSVLPSENLVTPRLTVVDEAMGKGTWVDGVLDRAQPVRASAAPEVRSSVEAPVQTLTERNDVWDLLAVLRDESRAGTPVQPDFLRDVAKEIGEATETEIRYFTPNMRVPSDVNPLGHIQVSRVNGRDAIYIPQTAVEDPLTYVQGLAREIGVAKFDMPPSIAQLDEVSQIRMMRVRVDNEFASYPADPAAPPLTLSERATRFGETGFPQPAVPPDWVPASQRIGRIVDDTPPVVRADTTQSVARAEPPLAARGTEPAQPIAIEPVRPGVTTEPPSPVRAVEPDAPVGTTPEPIAVRVADVEPVPAARAPDNAAPNDALVESLRERLATRPVEEWTPVDRATFQRGSERLEQAGVEVPADIRTALMRDGDLRVRRGIDELLGNTGNPRPASAVDGVATPEPTSPPTRIAVEPANPIGVNGSVTQAEAAALHQRLYNNSPELHAINRMQDDIAAGRTFTPQENERFVAKIYDSLAERYGGKIQIVDNADDIVPKSFITTEGNKVISTWDPNTKTFQIHESVLADSQKLATELKKGANTIILDREYAGIGRQPYVGPEQRGGVLLKDSLDNNRIAAPVRPEVQAASENLLARVPGQAAPAVANAAPAVGPWGPRPGAANPTVGPWGPIPTPVPNRVPNVGQVTRPQVTPPTVTAIGAGTQSSASRFGTWVGNNPWKTLFGIGALWTAYTFPGEVWRVGNLFNGPAVTPPPPAGGGNAPPPASTNQLPPVLPPRTAAERLAEIARGPAGPFTGGVYNPNGEILGQNYNCVTSLYPVIVVPLSAGSRFPSNCYNPPPSSGGLNSLGGLLGMLLQRAFAPQPPTPQPITPPQPIIPPPPIIPPTPTSTPVAKLIANPDTVDIGGTSVLSWASIGTTECKLASERATLIERTATQGSTTTPELLRTTAFTVTCKTPAAPVFATTTVRVR